MFDWEQFEPLDLFYTCKTKAGYFFFYSYNFPAFCNMLLH